MTILELDDFEFHADIMSALNERELDELSFSQMFVFLIDWAVKNNCLGEELKRCAVFNENYPKLLSGDISFSDFVLNVLDGKLIDSNFSSEALPFIKDYIEYDGYVDDLAKVYKTNLGILPANLKLTGSLCGAINESRKNYEINKNNFPDLIVFTDPDELLKQQKGVF